MRARVAAGPAERPPADDERSRREQLAEVLEVRLSTPVSVLGLLFVLVVLGEILTRDTRALNAAFVAAGWALWALFVLEFLVRLFIAPSRAAFLRRNWWQIVFLAVPFLRFLAVLRASRAARAAASAVRAGRGAAARLRSRITLLAAITTLVVLASAEILFELGEFAHLGEALYATALNTVAGEPFAATGAAARLVAVVLAIYSVVVFAALAGAIGAYFFEGRDADAERVARTGADATGSRTGAAPRSSPGGARSGAGRPAAGGSTARGR
ncbi:MAG TPA: hypothetical protein VHL78_06745 [Actinomycetota bacterium]|nr:hypothetical protein [Actinomycetota bacterium]